jgi:predicted dehydrogenase
MTPVGPRIEIFGACVEAGCNVFTEKPIALNNADAETCVKIVEGGGKLLSVGCNERHNPPSYTMAKLFRDGVLGDLIKVYAQTYINRDNHFWAKKLDQPDAWRLTFEASGGRIFEFAIHLVNWVQWIGGDPIYVAGANDAVSEALAKNNLDDVVSALFKFKQGYGVVETIMAPGNRKGGRRDMGIIGTKGECYFDKKKGQVRVIVPDEDRDEYIDPLKCPTKAEEFLNVLDSGGKMVNDGAAAIATTRMCSAFNEAVRTQTAVML